MTDEEADVRGQDAVVRVGLDVVGEVRRVVPDIEAAGDLRPAVEVVEEGLVAGIVEGFGERALDAAEPDDDVRSGPDEPGRPARVLVGQGVDGEAGEFGLDIGRDGVDEAQERPGRAAFFFVDGPAFRAGARAEAVVLGDGGDRGGRVGPKPLFQVIDQLPAHVLIRQAELGVLGSPPAVDLAEPFRMSGEVSFRRDEGVERMDKTLVDLAAAPPGVAARPGAVGPVAGGPDGIESDVPVGLPVFERRLVTKRDIADRERRPPGHAAGRPGPPAAADDVLEERVNGVEGAPRAASDENEVVPDGADDDLLGRQIREGRVHPGRLGRAEADEQAPAGPAGPFDDRERGPGDDAEEQGQLTGRVPLGLGRAGREDDPGRGLPATGQRHSGRSGNCGNGQKHERSCGCPSDGLAMGYHGLILTQP